MALFPRSKTDRQARRREDGGVAALSFELESLEFVGAGGELGLLRVIGRWTAPEAGPLGEVALVIERGTETIEAEPLPDPTGAGPAASPDGVDWRAAFTLTADVAEDPRAVFILCAGDQVEFELPRPGDPGGSDAPEFEVVEEPDTVEEVDPDQEKAALRAEVELLRVQLEEARTELEVERRRRASLAEDLQAHISVADDLRNTIATQEAQFAWASQQRREAGALAKAAAEGKTLPSQPASEEFLARLERARRASETAAG